MSDAAVERAGEPHVRSFLPASDVRRLRVSGTRQADAILAYFQAHPGVALTPFEVWEGVAIACPVTSIRRALTNLSSQGLLVKDVDAGKRERFGTFNAAWRLA